MICFELYINNRRVSRAGIPGFAVLNTILTWVNRRARPNGPSAGSSLSVGLSGLDSNGPDWDQGTQMGWASETVKPGDTIKIRILETDKPDAPKSSHPTATLEEAKASRKKSRRYYLALYKRQRKRLDREIGLLERDANKGKTSATKRPRRSGVQK